MDTRLKAKQIVQESLEEAVNWGQVGKDIGSGIAISSKYLYKKMKPIVKSAIRKSMELISSAGFKIGSYFKSKLEDSVNDCLNTNKKTEVKQIVKNSLTHGDKLDEKTSNFVADIIRSMNGHNLDDDYFVNKYLVNKSPKQVYREIDDIIPLNSPIREDEYEEEETLSELSLFLISSYNAALDKYEKQNF